MEKMNCSLSGITGYILIALAVSMLAVYSACASAISNTSQPAENTASKQYSGSKGEPVNVLTPMPEEVWKPLSLRYDILTNKNDEYQHDQIAIWHTNCKCSSISYGSLVCRGDTGNAVSSTDSETQASPLIILPSITGQGVRGMFIVAADYSGGYRLASVASSANIDNVDDETLLNQRGWGLATTFSPDRLPYRIQGINLCGIAYYTVGPLGEYDKHHIVVRILDQNGAQIWNKLIPWSYFRSTDTYTVSPKAEWKNIPVDNLTVDGDFTVEVITESNLFQSQGPAVPDASYVALAYERISDTQNIDTRSYISYDGKKAKDYIRLYDPVGDSLGFNLCLRTDGSYLEK